MAQSVEAACSKPRGSGFDCRNPSCHTITLESAQTLKEMSTRGLSWRVNVAGL